MYFEEQEACLWCPVVDISQTCNAVKKLYDLRKLLIRRAAPAPCPWPAPRGPARARNFTDQAPPGEKPAARPSESAKAETRETESGAARTRATGHIGPVAHPPRSASVRPRASPGFRAMWSTRWDGTQQASAAHENRDEMKTHDEECMRGRKRERELRDESCGEALRGAPSLAPAIDP